MAIKKYTLVIAKEYIESIGFTLLNYDEKTTYAIFIDKEGYLYKSQIYKLKSNRRPRFIDSRNPFVVYNIKLWLLNHRNNLRLVSDYKNWTTKLVVKDYEGYIYSILPQGIIRNYIPRIVDMANDCSIQNLKLWLIKNNKNFILLSSEYNGCENKLLFKCINENCRESFYMNWLDISQGNGCPFCAGKQAGLSNCLATKRPDLISEWHLSLNGDLTPYDVTCGCNKDIIWQCGNNLNHIWKAKIYNRTLRNDGCPQCNQSKGEVKIEEVLNINKIYNISQHKFLDCKYINSLEFDFFLPDYNIIVEYQGKHHYEPVDFAGRGIEWAEEQFKENQIKDQIKRDYCKNNDIKLIEIPYWDFDNIEEILIKELNLDKVN